MCISIHTHIKAVYMCIYIHTHKSCVHAHIHIHTHIKAVYMRTSICTHTHKSCAHAHIHTHTHIYAVYMCTYICTHTRIRCVEPLWVCFDFPVPLHLPWADCCPHHNMKPFGLQCMSSGPNYSQFLKDVGYSPFHQPAGNGPHPFSFLLIIIVHHLKPSSDRYCK